MSMTMRSYVIPMFGVLILCGLFSVSSFAQVAPATLSESDCLTSSNLGSIEQSYTVVTCDNPFNVSVNMGQRLQIQNPTGGNANMLPSASYGTVGTHSYSSGSTSGTIKLQNPPDVGITFQNVQVSFSGSQMSVSGNILNSNNFPVKNLYVYWHVTDNSGNYLSSWQRFGNDGQAYGTLIPAQSTGTFSETVCCLSSSGAVQATPYLVQAFREDGTKLISTSSTPAKPQDGSFVLPCNMQEKGDGVFTSSCNGFYENGFAKTKVGINYGSGLFPIKNYEAVGYFIDKNGNQGQNIKVTLDQINPKESKALIFVNPISGFVSEFKMQMLGGQLVTKTMPQPVTETTPQPVDKAEIQMMEKSSQPSCANNDSCYSPSKVFLSKGGTITWYNDDVAVHTATSAQDSTEEFDSSMIQPAKSFSYTFNNDGVFSYFCLLHPWAKGIIIVGNGISTPTTPVISANIQLNQQVYTGSEIVSFSGKVTGIKEGEILNVFVIDPNGNQVSGKWKLGVGGRGAISSDSPQTYTIDGKYRLQLKYQNTLLAEKTFEYSANSAPSTPKATKVQPIQKEVLAKAQKESDQEKIVTEKKKPEQEKKLEKSKKTKEQLVKEKTDKIKKAKELAKAKALEKTKQKAKNLN